MQRVSSASVHRRCSMLGLIWPIASKFLVRGGDEGSQVCWNTRGRSRGWWAAVSHLVCPYLLASPARPLRTGIHFTSRQAPSTDLGPSLSQAPNKLFRWIHGEGNGNPLQCSCLENPRDGGAWWAAVYGVAQSRPRLKRLSSSSSSSTPLSSRGERAKVTWGRWQPGWWWWHHSRHFRG